MVLGYSASFEEDYKDNYILILLLDKKFFHGEVFGKLYTFLKTWFLWIKEMWIPMNMEP